MTAEFRHACVARKSIPLIGTKPGALGLFSHAFRGARSRRPRRQADYLIFSTCYKRDPVHTWLQRDMIWVRESIRLLGGDDRRREYGC